MSSNNDFWAVYKRDSEVLIAYSQNIFQNDSINYSSIKFHPDHLRLYPSYALFFEMNNYYLNKRKLKYVNDGARNISHDTNIQDYLIQKFKFRKAYCKLNIIYRGDIGVVVKILFPFRKFIGKIDYKITNKITVLLKQEQIRRKCRSARFLDR